MPEEVWRQIAQARGEGFVPGEEGSQGQPNSAAQPALIIAVDIKDVLQEFASDTFSQNATAVGSGHRFQ